MTTSNKEMKMDDTVILIELIRSATKVMEVCQSRGIESDTPVGKTWAAAAELLKLHYDRAARAVSDGKVSTHSPT